MLCAPAAGDSGWQSGGAPGTCPLCLGSWYQDPLVWSLRESREGGGEESVTLIPRCNSASVNLDRLFLMGLSDGEGFTETLVSTESAHPCPIFHKHWLFFPYIPLHVF